MTVPNTSTPHEGVDVSHPSVEYGPDSADYPCPICSGVPLSSVSAELRADHEEHVGKLGAVDTDAEPCTHSGDTWFDRSICPEPCGSMHDVCNDCGATMGYCPIEGNARVGGPVTKPVDFFSEGSWFTHRLDVDGTWEVVTRPDEKISGANGETVLPLETAVTETLRAFGFPPEPTTANLDLYLTKLYERAREGLRADLAKLAGEWAKTYDGGLRQASTELLAALDADRKKPFEPRV